MLKRRLVATCLAMAVALGGNGTQMVKGASAQEGANRQVGVYEEFNTLCTAHFGAEKEEEV